MDDYLKDLSVVRNPGVMYGAAPGYAGVAASRVPIRHSVFRGGEDLYSIGVDLGGTKIYTAVVDSIGSIVKATEVPTLAQEGPERVIGRILQTIQEVGEGVRGTVRPGEIVGVGIGSPGPLDFRTGLVLSPPNLPGWDKLPLRQRIEDETGLPTLLDNDANVAALAEFHFGAGQGVQNMVYVTVSTGIGGGLILDGQLYRGRGGFAGEFGHIMIDAHGPICGCGNTGCLEALASGTAISRRAEERLGQSYTAAEVAKLADQGNEDARAILSEVFFYLGHGLVNLVNLFDPERIVIGGGVAQIGQPMFDALKEIVRSHVFSKPTADVEIVPAQLGRNCGVLGAAMLPMVGVRS